MDPDKLFEDVFEKYCAHFNPGLARLVTFAGFGIEMEAEGCIITDHEGRRFIDCLGGYGTFALGHRHPKVVEAVKRQLDSLALSGKAFLTKQVADLAAKLAEITPEGLEYCFFCNSGTEAVEAALKFAKATTGRSRFVSTEGSYHGKTIGALSVTGREKYRKPFEPLLPGVAFVPYGDAAAAVAAIDDKTAAMIVEPVQGEGGIIVPPDGYLRELRKACDAHGALLIADEVQSGLGRSGYLFACEHDGISPDLMPLAKSLGGGVMPLGVVIGTQAVWDAVFGPNPLAHTSTFGGNALACAAGLAALEVLLSENLTERSRVLGAKMKAAFEEVARRHADLVLEVRGRGLMIGVEFRMD
ncbi:MAG: aspartate aminotransferase family protein, partial [Fimbriimonas ginsengisoli]|nr:aspartate aminotransferase family protein [Fimbriimonas ginsengisoli]